MKSLSDLINPSSIAIVGASNNTEKVGGIIFHNLLQSGYDGRLYPVNSKDEHVQGRKSYKSISQIDEKIDLVCIAIPSIFVIDIVKEAISIGAKAIIIISAGFSETGVTGKNAEEEIVKLCRDNDILLLGPNCLGLLNTSAKMNCSFSSGMPALGNISVISQSGAIISALIDWSKSSGVGFSKILSVGNKADIDECDLLEYLYKDDDTKVIVMYLENLEITKRLSEILIRHSKEKPTVVLFGGRSTYGNKAASSHTGAIVSSYDAIKTYLKQSGVILANSMSRLFNLCLMFSKYRKIEGPNIAIVTNAGGPAIIACDSLAYYGLKLAELEDESAKRLSRILRPQSNINNPIDILGDGNEKEYESAIDVLHEDKNVDAIVPLLTIQSNTPTERIIEIIKSYKGRKPIACAFIGGETTHQFARDLTNEGFPCFVFPEDAIASLSALNFYSHTKIELKPPEFCGVRFDKNDLYSVANKYHLPITKYFHVNSQSHAEEIADKIGFPVVVKSADENIIHKTEKEAVVVNINNKTELAEAIKKIGKPAVIGKMVHNVHEIFIGAKKYDNMGTVILFGTGGIYAEIYNDMSSRFAPISKQVALEMIKETKIGKILSGARNKKPFDLDRLADIIVETSNFVDDHCNIQEIDFNPVIADASNYHIVDARIILKD